MNVTQMSPPDDDNAIMSCHHNINVVRVEGEIFALSWRVMARPFGRDLMMIMQSCHVIIVSTLCEWREKFFGPQLAGDGKTVWSGPDDDDAIMSCHHNINTFASGGRNFCAQLAGDGKTVWLGPEVSTLLRVEGEIFALSWRGDGKTVWSEPLSTASGTWYIAVDPI